MRSVSSWILPVIFATLAFCQEFEVVSIKPDDSGPGHSDSDGDQGRLTAHNLSLKNLIATAYGMKEYQIAGPDWIGSTRFDISAKLPDGLPKGRDEKSAAMRNMMQKMLADRFKLVAHNGEKSFTVYGLAATKAGIKFKEAPACEGHTSSSKNNHYEGTCISMVTFADFLSRRQNDLPADLPVLDMTGLKGFYNLTLTWISEPRHSDDAAAAGDIKSGPVLTDAIQEQLGLKLETRKALIPILIVDSAERVPTEN